jgi:hypothetical protein
LLALERRYLPLRRWVSRDADAALGTPAPDPLKLHRNSIHEMALFDAGILFCAGSAMRHTRRRALVLPVPMPNSMLHGDM